jgi:poly(3-hydroxybutyrate) depolymerase
MSAMLARSLLPWLLLAACAPAHADDAIAHRGLGWQGQARTFEQFIPAGAGTAPAPVLVLLHGSGQRGLPMAQRWQALAARENLILLAPDSRDPQNWNLLDDGPAFFYALLEAVRKEHPVDSKRIYLFGNSGGAVYALTLAMLEADWFAAAALHGGGWRAEGEYALMNYATRKIPLALYAGDRDPVFPPEAATATRQVLAGQGFPAQLELIPGHDHDYRAVADTVDEEAWAFLKARSIEGEPKFYAYRFGVPGGH